MKAAGLTGARIPPKKQIAQMQLPPAHARSHSNYTAHNISIWRERGGGDLEPVLASGAMALVDAQWIISHAEAGGVVTHRQALPKEAFLSLADLVEASRASLGGLPVIALSCPALANDWYNRGQRFGVFWDFLSLHQHPDPAHGRVRTAEENRLFRQGLGCLGRLFAHPHTTVLRTASYPEGYDGRKWSAQLVLSLRDQYEGLPGPNLWRWGHSGDPCRGKQSTRGDWRLAGDPWYDRSAMISECAEGGDRWPPLLPSQFTERLDARAFTEGKDDKALVSRLYAGAFREEMRRATRLGYGGLGWGDAEAAQVARVIASGALPRLEALSFLLNDVGDDGARALAAALGRKWVATRLSRVDLCGNSIRDGGAKALAAALAHGGACPSLRQLYLDYNCIGDKGAEALAAALGRAGAPQLKRLCLGSNAIGEGGVGALDAALLRRAAMVGDESMLARRGQTRRSLERRAGRGQTPLEIDYSRLTKEGAKRLLARHGRPADGPPPHDSPVSPTVALQSAERLL
ncbi:hypothetical protein EMIHUDRAFT_451501 [Emiliania huxleyi CCMP1516]|uniref:Uncharacterized protein n=2 Tax=Emiliania huxleyi TaxID=2903 RepID=A0A0D3J061_EMIH1|nr:hypothetical protein EMIHUDRAFT_451501 [Emiliania huxleyi CCMP1516]EOD16896.1 hypothetical protein EMIHUDRAFT_451501 [Emiliania huxleyi CCMP1516]|eukprot:XP_005769325.1 hypothetical protein EMIHUDRAFT_451501 [Emiliania huxleyi CCMP1516]